MREFERDSWHPGCYVAAWPTPPLAGQSRGWAHEDFPADCRLEEQLIEVGRVRRACVSFHAPDCYSSIRGETATRPTLGGRPSDRAARECVECITAHPGVACHVERVPYPGEECDYDCRGDWERSKISAARRRSSGVLTLNSSSGLSTSSSFGPIARTASLSVQPSQLRALASGGSAPGA